MGQRIDVQRNRTGTGASDQSGIGSILGVKTKVWLERDGRFAIGDGGLCLLLGISATGSLAAAVREIGWSYRHAWGYLRRAEEVLGVPLLVARPGKGAARGATLTDHGRLLLERLTMLRRCIDDAVGPSRADARRDRRPGQATTQALTSPTVRRPRALRRRSSAPSR